MDMPLATGKVKGSAPSASFKPAGAMQDCEGVLLDLEKEADLLLDKFVSTIEHGRKFHSSLEKIEGQIDYAKRKQAAESELELNEVAVIADKLIAELDEAHRMASGAALSELQEEWAGSFESVRAALDRMSMSLKKAKSSMSHRGEGVLEARGHILAFTRDASRCKKRLDSLKAAFSKKGAPHARVASARRKAEIVRHSVGKQFDRLTKKRLARKVAEAKEEIVSFMGKTREGRIFVDRKHLTLTSKGQRMRVPFTQSVRFGLEEIAPIDRELSRLGSAVVVGSYEQEDGKSVLRIGQRSLVGDAIVFREKSYFV
jgi:hypothetical protein